MLGSAEVQKQRLGYSKEIGKINQIVEKEVSPILDELNRLAAQSKNLLNRKYGRPLSDYSIEYLRKCGVTVEVFKSGTAEDNNLQYLYAFQI